MMARRFLLICCSILLSACQFHLQSETNLAPALHSIYLQSQDPYGHLARNLKEYMKMSDVTFTDSPNDAKTMLVIVSDTTAQRLLSVNGTLQTRQYNLIATVTFEITDSKGLIIVPPQSLSETRSMTVQSNEILGSSNEANLFFQQMRRSLAYAIVNRISSQQITQTVNDAFPVTKGQKKR